MNKFLKLLLFFFSLNAYSQNRPNIVFIIADDLGQEDLGCYGNPFNETPNIDKLAKNGILFTQSYSASPVCSPSRGALMTGKHPARTKLTNFIGGERKDSLSPVNPANWQRSLPASEITIAEKLKGKGYTTAMIGKWHLGIAEGETAWGQGFDFGKVIGKNGLDYYNYSIFEDNLKNEWKDDGTHYLTDKLSDYAIEFIKETPNNQPFFLYLAYSAPHVLLIPRGDKLAKYMLKYEKYGNKFNPNYAAMIESMDDGLGKIIEHLKLKNLLENTIIVFTSDNGFVGLPELGPTPNIVSKFRKWKGHVYEGGIRTPLLISWKDKFIANSTCQNQVVNTDFFNTFLEVLGEKVNENLDSKSFYLSLKNPTQNIERTDIFWHYPHFSNQLGRPAGAIRLGDWKLIKSYETNKIELFNIANDIAETNDLSKTNISKANELNDLLLKRLIEMNANMPIKK